MTPQRHVRGHRITVPVDKSVVFCSLSDGRPEHSGWLSALGQMGKPRLGEEVWPPGPWQGQSRVHGLLPPAHSFLSFSKAVETEIFCLLVIVTA